jgi:hypothetical protein
MDSISAAGKMFAFQAVELSLSKEELYMCGCIWNRGFVVVFEYAAELPH